MAKNIRGFLETSFEYFFLNIIVNINFFSDLKFEYHCEYYPEILLHVSLKLSGDSKFQMSRMSRTIVIITEKKCYECHSKCR